MLKESSIQKIKESNYKSKLKASKNHYNKLCKRKLEYFRKIDNSRNLNKVSLSNGESIKHQYAKFIVSLYCKLNDEDFVTEYVINNKEVDVFMVNSLICVELENNGHQKAKENKKLNNYHNEINSGMINDVFIISLKDFTGNLNKDLEMIKGRLI